MTSGPQTQPETIRQSLLPVYFFLGLSAALAWTVWLWPIDNRFLLVKLVGWRINWPLSNIKLLIGNSLPGVLALVWAGWEGKRSLAALLSSLFAWRTRIKWYVLAIAMPSGVLLTSMCVVLALYSEMPVRPPVLVLVNSVVALPFGPVWEEIAWRAFALRKLQRRYSLFSSAIVIGVYWALWHIPMWLLTLNYLTLTLLLIDCVNLVSWSVAFSFLYHRSGQSLPVTVVLHSTVLVMQNLVYAAVLRGTIYLIPLSATLSLSLAVILGKKLKSGRVTRHS